MIRRISLALLSATFLALVPTITSADDFAPPPWPRSDPFAVTAEWEFLGPANPAPPDGPLTNVGTKGSGSVGTSVLITGSPAGLGWGGTSGGNWFFPDGGSMFFTVDNIIDHEPIKHLHLQVTATPALVLGLDPLGAMNFGATGAIPGTVSSTTTLGTSPFGPVAHTLFTWDMRPNPPFEYFRLDIFGGGEIRQVVLDTISTAIPEPTTFVVYGLVFMVVGMAWRRFKHALA